MSGPIYCATCGREFFSKTNTSCEQCRYIPARRPILDEHALPDGEWVMHPTRRVLVFRPAPPPSPEELAKAKMPTTKTCCGIRSNRHCTCKIGKCHACLTPVQAGPNGRVYCDECRTERRREMWRERQRDRTRKLAARKWQAAEPDGIEIVCPTCFAAAGESCRDPHDRPIRDHLKRRKEVAA